MPDGFYGNENPTHPILSSSQKPGLPIIVRVDAFSPSFTNVNCTLHTVSGDIRTGTRGSEVRCHLSHAGKDAPQGFPSMWSMIALTPYEVLKPGIYEASFAFDEAGTPHSCTWRFQVGR